MAEEKKTTKAVVVSEKETQINTFISSAIEKGLPVETMQKLFDLHKEVKADQAREAFVMALGNFQKDIPVIKKTKKVLNKDGQSVRYQYAPLDSIVAQIKKPLVDNGLSFNWQVENKPDLIRATATVTHFLGHSESSSFEIPIDKEGFMTAPQKYASALTFAKRYALVNALGISTADEDTDASDVGKETTAKSAKSRIIFALRALGHESKDWDTATWNAEIKKLVNLPLTEKNIPEVASRLEALVKEKQEYENTKV